MLIEMNHKERRRDACLAVVTLMSSCSRVRNRELEDLVRGATIIIVVPMLLLAVSVGSRGRVVVTRL